MHAHMCAHRPWVGWLNHTVLPCLTLEIVHYVFLRHTDSFAHYQHEVEQGSPLASQQDWCVRAGRLSLASRPLPLHFPFLCSCECGCSSPTDCTHWVQVAAP